MTDIRVLIVDDEPTVRTAVRHAVTLVATVEPGALFRHVDIDECEGPDGEFHRLVETKSFDLAIVDYRLVNGTGFSVLKALAPVDPLCETKVLLYTAVSKFQVMETALEALRLGAFTFVRKGEGGELKEEIRRVLKAIWLERNRAMVGSFVDRKLRGMLADPSVMDKLRAGCIVEKGFLFCDITGSTPFVNELQRPMAGHSVVGPVLRELLSWIGEVIQKRGGIVDKFIGDEVMAYFRDSLEPGRAPEEEVRQICDSMVEAALEIRDGFKDQVEKVLDVLNVQHRPKAKPWVKCVISYDTVVWGVLGSERYLDLTILTDGVVRTARVMQHRERKQKLVGGGDIYLLDQAWRALTPGRYLLGTPRDIQLRDFNNQKVVVCNVVGWGRPLDIHSSPIILRSEENSALGSAKRL